MIWKVTEKGMQFMDGCLHRGRSIDAEPDNDDYIAIALASCYYSRWDKEELLFSYDSREEYGTVTPLMFRLLELKGFVTNELTPTEEFKLADMRKRDKAKREARRMGLSPPEEAL